MRQYMDYTKISKDTIGHLYAGYKSLHDSPLAASLKALIEIGITSKNNFTLARRKDIL